jgi:hypothetical protein
MDIVEQIDAATGCQHCEGPLGDSPSSDFCSPRCQWRWHAGRAEPLVHYKEPTDLAAHVHNQVELRSPHTTPSPAGAMVMHVRPDLSAFQPGGLIEALHVEPRTPYFARAFSGGSIQPRRIDDDSVPALLSPGRVMLGFDGSRSSAVIVAAWRDEHVHFVAALSNAMHTMGAAVEHAGQALGRLLPHLHAGPASRPEPADVMQRALDLRRARNTGPAHASRAPRRIDPRRAR